MNSMRFGAPPGSFVTRPQTFDHYMADFNLETDEVLSHGLLTRNQLITPKDTEQENINALVSRTKAALETVVAADALGDLKIEEVREVGSYKKGTMITRNNVADIVVMFKGLPKTEDVKLLGNKVIEHLKTGVHQNDVFGVVEREFGCEIAGTQAVIRLLVAIPGDQLGNLDPEIHCKSGAIQKNLAALRHAHWFEHSSQPAIKILIRLIKDIKQRCKGLAALDIWTIELLCHYCVTCTLDRNPLPLSLAFRRFFQLLASGFLLHTSVAVADPCDPTRRINYGFDLAESDLICRTAQFITRLLTHEQYDQLLGVKFAHKDIGSETETDTNLSIAPLSELYNKEQLVNLPSAENFYSRVAV